MWSGSWERKVSSTASATRSQTLSKCPAKHQGQKRGFHTRRISNPSRLAFCRCLRGKEEVSAGQRIGHRRVPLLRALQGLPSPSRITPTVLCLQVPRQASDWLLMLSPKHRKETGLLLKGWGLGGFREDLLWCRDAFAEAPSVLVGAWAWW